MVLDLVSFWPGWVVTAGVLLIHRWVSHTRQRFPGYGLGPALPYSLMAWLAVALSLHMVGWEMLPSSADRLDGPAVTDRIATTAIDVRLDGALVVEAGAEFLYEVSSLASAGAVAPPRGEELLTGDDLDVRLREGSEAGSSDPAAGTWLSTRVETGRLRLRPRRWRRISGTCRSGLSEWRRTVSSASARPGAM